MTVWPRPGRFGRCRSWEAAFLAPRHRPGAASSPSQSVSRVGVGLQSTITASLLRRKTWLALPCGREMLPAGLAPPSSKAVVRHGMSRSPGLPSSFSIPRSLFTGSAKKMAAAPSVLAAIICRTRSITRSSKEYSLLGSTRSVTQRGTSECRVAAKQAASSWGVSGGTADRDKNRSEESSSRNACGQGCIQLQPTPRFTGWPTRRNSALISSIFCARRGWPTKPVSSSRPSCHHPTWTPNRVKSVSSAGAQSFRSRLNHSAIDPRPASAPSGATVLRGQSSTPTNSIPWKESLWIKSASDVASFCPLGGSLPRGYLTHLTPTWEINSPSWESGKGPFPRARLQPNSPRGGAGSGRIERQGHLAAILRPLRLHRRAHSVEARPAQRWVPLGRADWGDWLRWHGVAGVAMLVRSHAHASREHGAGAYGRRRGLGLQRLFRFREPGAENVAQLKANPRVRPAHSADPAKDAGLLRIGQ